MGAQHALRLRQHATKSPMQTVSRRAVSSRTRRTPRRSREWPVDLGRPLAKRRKSFTMTRQTPSKSFGETFAGHARPGSPRANGGSTFIGAIAATTTAGATRAHPANSWFRSCLSPTLTFPASSSWNCAGWTISSAANGSKTSSGRTVRIIADIDKKGRRTRDPASFELCKQLSARVAGSPNERRAPASQTVWRGSCPGHSPRTFPNAHLDSPSKLKSTSTSRLGPTYNAVDQDWLDVAHDSRD